MEDAFSLSIKFIRLPRTTRQGITVQNGIIKNYFYGMLIQQSSNIELSDMDLSNNYVDPRSLGPNPPA